MNNKPIIATSGGALNFLLYFLEGLYVTNISLKLLVKNLTITDAPIPAAIQTAGAKTKRRRTITLAK
jgi:hypothetical protein